MKSRLLKQLSFMSLMTIGLGLFFQNCQSDFKLSDSDNASETDLSSLESGDITRGNPSGQLCHRWVTGNDQNGVPTWGPLIGDCDKNSLSLLFSVTHENECNTHMECKEYPNDLNYRNNIYAYMADYAPKDIGQWLKYSATGSSSANQIEFSIDTINYASVKSPTGRPVSNGYLFFGMANLDFVNNTNMNEELWIDFEYNVAASELGNPAKAGHRLMVAAALIWDEPGRANKTHYFEVNLFKTQGYHDAHYDIDQCTKDTTYDHCYYDPNGKWAEGKYVSTTLAFGEPGPTVPDGQWRRVRVDLFKLAKRFQWFHPPSDWSRARTDGLYIGLETRDSSRIYAKIRNLRIWKGSTPPTTSTPIHGGWSSWQNQGTCSKTCGGGVITQVRSCTNPAPANGGASCSGSNTQTVTCNTQACPTTQTPQPVNGAWSSWQNQGTCSKTCGGGVITQVRSCTNPAPANGGASCSGSNTQTVTCNTQACLTSPSNKVTNINGTSRPVGLFRDGQGGYKSNGTSYCSFSSDSQMFSSGYTQAEYDSARQISTKQIVLSFVGTCTDTLNMGLRRQGSAGIIVHKDESCLLSSGDHLRECGFRQQDYDSAIQINLGDLSRLPTCQCW